MIVQVVHSKRSSVKAALQTMLSSAKLSFRVTDVKDLADTLITSAYNDKVLVVIESETTKKAVEALLRKGKFPGYRTLLLLQKPTDDITFTHLAAENEVQVCCMRHGIFPRTLGKTINLWDNESRDSFSAEDVDDQDNEVKLQNRPPLHFKHVLVGQGFTVKEQGELRMYMKIKKTKAVELTHFAEVHHDIPVFSVVKLDPDLVVDAFTGEQCYKIASAFKF